nr:MAG TPA: hypothetical protein [Siphoviridae sp. ctYIp7]
MGCGCENKKRMETYERVALLAKKAAVLEGCIYVIYRKSDGTYAFDKEGSEIDGTIVEYKHYL